MTAAVVGLLAGAAVVIAEGATCDDPGRYVVGPHGVELVGGCLDGRDLPVAPPPLRDGPFGTGPSGD